MTMRFSYALTDLGNTVVRLGSISGLTMRAYKGEVASCDIILEDPAGTIDIEPFRSFVVDELACSAIRIGKWYIVQRDYTRTDSLRTGAARSIKVALYDLNATLSMKLITHSTFHYKRPAETDEDRINWLLAQVLDTIPIVDSGLIDFSDPVQLSAVDYTGQFPLQVLTDCANRSNKNFFIYSDESTGASSLAYFKSTDASMYVSTLTFSNVLADLTSTCLPPLQDASGEADPSLVYDGVYMPYSGGSVYVRAAGRFLARDVVGPSANTSDRARATELAQKMLDNHDSEQSTVTFTAKIPAAQVNLIKEGMFTTARFSHIPGWETGRDVRVLNRAVKQDEEDDQFYNVELAVGHPVLVNFTPGPNPDDGRVWPSDQPPFKPNPGGAISYIQSTKVQITTGDPTATATLGAAPTAGNFLGIYIGQVQVDRVFPFGLPDGWTVDHVYVPPGDHAPAQNCQMILASKISDGTETSVVIDNTEDAPEWEVFYFEYSGATGYGGFADGQQAGSSTFTIPSVTPTSGLSTAVLAFLNWDPDYVVVSPLANERQYQSRGGWAARAAMSYSDTIISAASGSYNGTTSGSVGGETGYGGITAWLTSSSISEPAIGQPVAPESAISDGSQVIYQTSYPYVPGSLVVKVNGVILDNVDETDPDTGLFTLPAPPAVGAVITWTYNVADPAPTGANNPPAGTNPPGVPPGGGSFPGGDGTSRPPDQEYTPAETPDGIITVFTIVPYIAGQAFVYINGLIQRKDIDWSEVDPAAGTFEFSSPPWTGAAITVKAMPVTAPPTGSGFGNPALYGSGINADTKANLQNNATAVSHRFKSIGGILDTVRWQQRGGAVYSAGTGGSYDITVEADVSGVPSGTPLATESYTPGNPGGDWTTYDEVTFGSPATLVAGTLYHIVFTNTDGSPAANYVSVNELFMYGSSPIPAGQGRQPLFTDTDWAVLYGNVVQSRYTADMDLGYNGGAHQGMGYIQNMTAQYGTLSGTANMVRELFTVSGGARTVVSCAVRVRRSSGTSDLILGLYTGANALIEAVSIPAATVPISAAGGDNGGSVWAGARFLAPHILANGSQYYLRLSCASGTTYTAAPIRKGTTEGMDPDTVFMDGEGQFTTNSGASWTDLYTFDTDPPDLQMYLGTTS